MPSVTWLMVVDLRASYIWISVPIFEKCTVSCVKQLGQQLIDCIHCQKRHPEVKRRTGIDRGGHHEVNKYTQHKQSFDRVVC